MKLRLEIYGAEGMTYKNRANVIGNKVLAEKSKDKNVTDTMVEFEAKDVITYEVPYLPFLPFKRLRRKLMIIKDAGKCLSLYYTALEAVKFGHIMELPVYTRKEENDLAKANVLKTSGNISSRIQIPMMLYILLVLGAGISFMTLLVASGRLKI